MTHLEFHRLEMEALKPSSFEIWATRVESILGHNLDGDQEIDGYSLDGAYVSWESGMTAKEYAKLVS
jgi:hypothetical protein